MKGQDLITEQETFKEQFYAKISKWFLQEIKIISETHKVYIEDFGTLRIHDYINDAVYEPYSRENINIAENRIDRFEGIFKEIEVLTDTLNELDYRYLSYCYTDEHKFFN